MFSTGSLRTSARSARRRETHWLWVQTWTRSLCHCAIAQDGAIDAWAIYGRVYCRRMVRVAVPGGAAVLLSMTVDSDGCAFRNEARSSSSGRGSPSDQV